MPGTIGAACAGRFGSTRGRSLGAAPGAGFATRTQVDDLITRALPPGKIDGGRDLMNGSESFRSIVLY
ncbi:hypothetical protein BAN20980_00167 [Burkholderia anthina]|uniref:Uncharacterized protein n=1 Tax=Burkholderia anthina TaxID=179879 RepID=A0A6P2G1U6_9BURK|nr:hypothetical protein DCN14_28460 [Burkholderia sp. IDO3]VVU47477.1 hypothetical protein BAN20980_00167 [Burkholderia anthina]